MTRYSGLFCVLGLLGASSAWGQAQRGDGLKGEYYDGREFDRLVVTRRDANLDFDWHGSRPAAGLTPDDFSVRWTGWLVPPTTGRYVLHISADDGIRLWLNNRQLLDDWHGHSLNYYQVEVDLRAGEPYALRVDYCQHTQATQARLAWLAPAPAPTTTRRIRRVVSEHLAEAVVIPTRYLFSHLPTVLPHQPDTLVARQPLPQPEPPPASASRTAGPSKAALRLSTPPAGQKIRPVSYLRSTPAAVPATATHPPARPAATDSGRVAVLATRLASGQALTLRALYFEQGKADLLPQVQASLDTLARALVRRPTLRLEVQGHTDNQGDPAINQLLSRRRAEAVCQYLARRGVVASRLRAVGYGGSRPVANNRQPDLRPRNRRVVLLPLAR